MVTNVEHLPYEDTISLQEEYEDNNIGKIFIGFAFGYFLGTMICFKSVEKSTK